MTLNELIELHKDDNLINVKNIITNWNNDMRNTYNIFLSDNEIDIISNEINIKIILLGEFNLLYPVEEINDVNDKFNIIELNNIIRYSAFKISGELQNLIMYKDEDLKNGAIEINTKNDYGYQGFEVLNQDGNFQFTNQKQSSNDRYRYYRFLNSRVRGLADDVYNEIKERLLQGIY